MSNDHQILSRSSELKGHFEFLVFGIANDAGWPVHVENKRYISLYFLIEKLGKRVM